jgi:hypothetical protein
MARLDEKRFHIRRPGSYFESKEEEHEFYLNWFGRDGSPYQHLFFDWTTDTKTESEPINVQDEDELRSSIKSELSTITLTAENVPKEEFAILNSCKVSKNVFRIFPDNRSERYAVLSNTYKYDKNKAKYNVTIQLRAVQQPLVK